MWKYTKTERRLIFLGKILWKAFAWSALVLLTLSKWAWDEWTHFINRWEQRTGWLVRVLAIVPIAVFGWIWFFAYSNWQVIATEGWKMAICREYPVTCLKREVKQQVRENAAKELSNSGQLTIPAASNIGTELMLESSESMAAIGRSMLDGILSQLQPKGKQSSGATATAGQ